MYYVCDSCGATSNYWVDDCSYCGLTGTYQISSKPTPTSKPKPKIAKVVSSATAVDPIELETYLYRCKVHNLPVVMRYQSKRMNSANKWRSVSMNDYNDTYIIARSYDNIPIRYRRDRVVEIKY